MVRISYTMFYFVTPIVFLSEFNHSELEISARDCFDENGDYVEKADAGNPRRASGSGSFPITTSPGRRVPVLALYHLSPIRTTAAVATMKGEGALDLDLQLDLELEPALISSTTFLFPLFTCNAFQLRASQLFSLS